MTIKCTLGHFEDGHGEPVHVWRPADPATLSSEAIDCVQLLPTADIADDGTLTRREGWFAKCGPAWCEISREDHDALRAAGTPDLRELGAARRRAARRNANGLDSA